MVAQLRFSLFLLRFFCLSFLVKYLPEAIALLICLLQIGNGGHEIKGWKCPILCTSVLLSIENIIPDVAFGASHRMHTKNSVCAVLYWPCLTDGKTEAVGDKIYTAVEFQSQTEIRGSLVFFFRPVDCTSVDK